VRRACGHGEEEERQRARTAAGDRRALRHGALGATPLARGPPRVLVTLSRAGQQPASLPRPGGGGNRQAAHARGQYGPPKEKYMYLK